jgi:membrane fusion protein, multidrug efflux system
MQTTFQAPSSLTVRLAAPVALMLVVSVLTACNKPDVSGKAADKAASAASGKADAAVQKPQPTLLLATEDLLTLAPRTVASGPVVSGTLQPERKADLRAEVAAVVLKVSKENGETVRAGERLVQLDDTAIRDSLASADAAVRTATQTLEQNERQVVRLKTLQQQGMTSAQALEDAENRRNAAQSELVAARSRVVAARQQLQRTEVRAPFDGVVSERKASVGDTVQVGKELLKVIDPRSMRFEGLVSADRIGELKVGQAVNFRVNGYTQGDFAGKVRRIDAAANAVTRQVAVVIDFKEVGNAPKVAGLFAEGRIETGSSQALLLPEGAVGRAGDAAWVWRIASGSAGVVNKVSVKLGERDTRTGMLPILQGLAAGDRVLRAPGSTLADGQKFETAASAPAPAPVSTPGPAASQAVKPAPAK